MLQTEMKCPKSNKEDKNARGFSFAIFDEVKRIEVEEFLLVILLRLTYNKNRKRR